MLKLSASKRFALGLPLLSILLILIAAGVTAYRATSEFTATLAAHKPSYTSLDAIGGVRELTATIEISGTNAVVTGSDDAVKQYEDASGQISEKLDALKNLTAGSPVQQERVALVGDLVTQKINALNAAIKTSKPKNRKRSQQLLPLPAFGEIRAILDRMAEDEKKTIDVQNAGLSAAAARPVQAVIVAAIAAAVLAALAYIFILWETERRKQTERLLRESEERFGLFADTTKEYAVALLDASGRIKGWNAGAERLFGYPPEEIRGKFFSRFYFGDQPRSQQPGQRLETAALQGLFEDEGMLLRRDGTPFVARETIHALRNEGGGLNGYAVVVQDVTEQRRTQEEIAKLELSVEHASDLVAITRPDGTIEYVNPAVEETTGYRKEDLIGKTLSVLRAREHGAVRTVGPPAEAAAGTMCRVSVNRKKSGELFYLSERISQLVDNAGKTTHLVVTARDVTRERKMKGRLSFLAHYDPLTNLPNRDDFMERLAKGIAQAKNDGKGLAVLVVGIDRFKYINDVFGGDAGNAVLKRVAERMQEAVGGKGMTSRLSGDEFGVMLSDIDKPANVVSSVGAIVENVTRGIEVKGRDVFMTLSSGAALFPSNGEDVKTLMKNADIALAHAKAQGINSFRFYSAEDNAKMSELFTMEQYLFNALRNDEYEMAYQPYCEMDGKRVAGAEALIRWINHDLGVVSPARFIHTLESTGLIIDVGAWVLKTVCAQVKRMSNGVNSIPMSVNLSPAQFRHERLVETVEETIKALAVNPRLINLEVTESVFMEDILFTKAVLERLKRLGVAISIDDFGTGYSSLSYLKKLPVDVLKIDQSFVKDVATDPDAASMITAITSMARSLGIKTIAEGVETEEQWKVLRLLRCDLGQGYYFSRALKADDFERYLEQGHARKKAANG